VKSPEFGRSLRFARCISRRFNGAPRRQAGADAALSDGQDGISVVAGDPWVEGTNEGEPVVHRVRAP
jgi:hypothetical protein